MESSSIDAQRTERLKGYSARLEFHRQLLNACSMFVSGTAAFATVNTAIFEGLSSQSTLSAAGVAVGAEAIRRAFNVGEKRAQINIIEAVPDQIAQVNNVRDE